MYTRLRYVLVASLLIGVGAGFSRPAEAGPNADGIRFAGSASVTQMRMEVRAPDGALVYDSPWKDGNLLDWSVATLPYGSYAVRIFTRDLEGRTAEKQATLRAAPEGVSIDDAAGNVKLTTTLHDGETGQLVTTAGDLFSFSIRMGYRCHASQDITQEIGGDSRGPAPSAQRG